jgi:hypothetical protein
MAVVINGTTGITSDGGYVGDGISFADGTPSNTLVTTTGGNVGIGTSSPVGKLHAKGTSAADVLYRLEPYSNYYGSKLLISSTSSGDGGIQYGASGSNDLDIFAYSNIKFLNGSISGGIGTERARIDTSGNLLSYKTQQVTTSSSATYGTATFYTRLTNNTSYTLATGTGLSNDTVVTATLEYGNLYDYNSSTTWAYGLRQAFLRGSTSGATGAGNLAIVNQTSGSGAAAPTFAWTGTSTISLTVTNPSNNEGWARVTVTWRNVTMSFNPVA